MEPDEKWTFSWSERFGNEDIKGDGMFIDSFVGCGEHIELRKLFACSFRIEFHSGFCGDVNWIHRATRFAVCYRIYTKSFG